MGGSTRRTRNIHRLGPGVLAAACLIGSVPAAAHPHVWVVSRSEIVFDEARRMSAIRHVWTFDAAYSAFMTMNLDPRRDGVPDPAKLAELARTNLVSIAEYGFFTHAKANGRPLVFGEPQAATQTYADGRLTLSFTLPLQAPMPAPKIMLLTVDDPTFFVAFNLAPGEAGMRLAGAPSGCAMNVSRATQVAEAGKQIVPDETAAVAAPAVAVDYTSRVIVACP